MVTRTHTQTSSAKRGIRRGTLSAKRGICRGTQHATTPAVTFYPRTETAQAPTNATSQIIQRGYTAPSALCAGPLSAASIDPAFELHKRSRSVSRAPQLSAAHVTRLYGGAISSLALPITVALLYCL